MLVGRAIDPATTRIDSATDSISIRNPVPPEASSACFACGWCVDVCPTGLTPVHMLEMAQRVDAKAPPEDSDIPTPAALLRSADAHESLHCIGCGLCSFVCPTRLPLTAETLRLRLRVIAADRSSHSPEGHPS